MLRNLLENGLLGELKALGTSTGQARPSPMRSDKAPPVSGRGLLVFGLTVLGAVLAEGVSRKSTDVPFWDQGGTNDWHANQWDFID
jgi:hypothetical protein